MGRESVQSLDRALSILVVLSKNDGPLGVTRLAGALTLAKSTVHRLLSTLERSGFVTRTREGQYGLGVRLWEMGCAAIRCVNVRDAARPVMQRLAANTGETVNLSVWDQGDAVFIEKVDGTAPVRLHSTIGGRAPAHATACGLLLLAHQDEETQTRICARTERFTERTITDPEQLRKRLDEIRREGYAFSHGTWHAGSSGIAAPVRSQRGEVVAALSIAAPAERMLRRAPELGRVVRAAADEVSLALDEPNARRRPA
jgi:DNA-binding IclR family transcriptional regulator